MRFSKILLPALCILAAPADTTIGQASKAPKLEAEWYQFRGPKRDGVAPDTGLLKEWPQGGPTLAWKITGIGSGYSAVSVVGNRVFTMGEAGGACSILALDAATGKLLWKSPGIGDSGNPDNRGTGPRGTPASDGTLVFGLGQQGTLAAVNAANGQLVWKKKMAEFGGQTPGWGYSESPLLDGNMVLCTPGGSGGTVVALAKMNGQKVWQSTQLKDGAHYTSLATAEIGKIPQYIVFTSNSVAGLMPRTGQVIWRVDRAGQTAICSTPVHKDGIVFVASGYGIGHNAFQVSIAGGQARAQEIYKGREMVNHHGGVVIVGDHVYGMDEQQLKCIELKTGKVVWSDRCVGKGSITAADGLLICRSENGEVGLVEASPAAYKLKGRFNPPDRSTEKAWSYPVVFGGKLYLRDMDTLLCYNLTAK